MKVFITIALLFINYLCIGQNKLGAIGQWRGHFDNHTIRQVIKGDDVYAASPFQIIKLNGPNAVKWIDKTTGLNDIGIEYVAWDPILKQLVITYENSNVDIVKDDQVFNINAIQLSNLYTDHKINGITIYNNWGLLSTNFGIVVIDLTKHEIKDTWFPNNNQQQAITYDIAIKNDSLFVATDNGIWTSPLKNNWILANQWSHLITYDSLQIKHFASKKNTLFAYNQSSLFQIPTISPLIKMSTGIIQKIDSAANTFNISVQFPNKKGMLIQLNDNLTTTTLVDSTMLVAPMQLVFENNNYWVADSSTGLLQKNNSNYKWIDLGGPKATINGIASINEQNLIAPFNDAMGYGSFNENGWLSNFQIASKQLPILYASSISNADESFWLTSKNGLVHITNNANIETIQPNNLTGDYKYIQSDQNNSIWALQDNQGIVRQSNASWASIPLPSNFIKNGLNEFIVNNQQQAWLIAPNKQGLYVYQAKDIYKTEIWNQLTTQASIGNLPSNNVTSIANDKTGSIWVGTDNGIGIFNCGDISVEPCNAYLPIVSNNGFNGYLFQKEIINTIAVDGANRKWIGTNNGAWLLSADGLEIIEHFTSSNSPLPSDTILQILIAPKTGEVFFNTTKQMVSFRGTATQGAVSQNTIQIFPNPVPPNFSGTIAFRGLVENAIVKITDLTGKLLYQTNALGGQAVWNGKTYEGRKVATGIYLVFVRDLNGTEKGVGKIVIADGY